jgi:hypothetical protein
MAAPDVMETQETVAQTGQGEETENENAEK